MKERQVLTPQERMQKAQQWDNAFEQMIGAVNDLMYLWEEQGVADLLNDSNDHYNAYKKTFPLSFDEWLSQLIDYREISTYILRNAVRDGDCLNCFPGNENSHHGSTDHPKREGSYSRPCIVAGCDCRGYYTMKERE